MVTEYFQTNVKKWFSLSPPRIVEIHDVEIEAHGFMLEWFHTPTEGWVCENVTFSGFSPTLPGLGELVSDPECEDLPEFVRPFMQDGHVSV